MAEIAPNSDETVEWQGSISHLHYVGRWLLALLLLAAAAGTFFYLPDFLRPYPWPTRAVLGAAALIVLFIIHLDRSQRRYTITTRRVIVEFGIVSRRSNEIRIQDIRSINLARSGVAGLFGVGRVEFASAADDDAEVIFWNAPGAERLRDLVRHLQSRAGV